MKTSAALETCEIAWWRGYVKGRFQAYVGPPARRELIGESPAFRWRSSEPPAPTAAAKAALGVLTDELAETGWHLEEHDAEPWFALRLSRPAVADLWAPTPTPVSPGAADPKPRLDEALLAELRSELDDAREAARLERGRRLEAEAEALRLKEPPPRRRPTQPLSAWALLASYGIAVAAAALVGLVGFESIYGAVVAGLTTLAVVVSVDSWIAARRRGPAAH